MNQVRQSGFNDFTPLHDEADSATVLKNPDILEGVAVDDDKIGKLSGFDTPNLLLHS
jgi:hypothetical protein